MEQKEPHQVQLDSRGRITLPENIRSEYNLKPGSSLYLCQQEDGTIILADFDRMIAMYSKRKQ
jgi:AbrB family looped-hinge helix DNA binding protein